MKPLADREEPAPRGPEKSAVGRARRFSIEQNTERGQVELELWVLPDDLTPIAGRLLELGEQGVMGFVEGARHGALPWLLRRLPRRTLAEAMRAARKPWAPLEVAALAQRIALGLQALESRHLAMGPLAPDVIGLDGERTVLFGEALLAAMVGATIEGPRTPAPTSPHYTPPAQADGAPWDFAANRYVLGLIVYRLLSGAHPFSGAGLRKALDDAQHQPAPPFEPEIAATLPAGLQGFVLRVLDPDAAARPKDAGALAEAFGRFAEGKDAGPAVAPGHARKRTRDHGESPRRPAPPSATSVTAPERQKKGRFPRWGQIALPIGIGVAIASASIAALAPAPPPKTHDVAIAPARPLSEAQATANDCATCHPRQAAEWRRSVMGHSVKSPLFNALEALVEEQVGRDFDCPNGAGILRKAEASSACKDRRSGITVTGSGGEGWCINCHSPAENLDARIPAWQGQANGDARTRLPVRDLLAPSALEGVSCGFCHQVHGPVKPGAPYQGNATWASFETGAVFASRPEDGRGTFGIGNSGYELAPFAFVFGSRTRGAVDDPYASGSPIAHKREDKDAHNYLRSSEFCGSCHDVRLFGTDSLGAAKGEHFKRLRNAYSEWVAWTDVEKRRGKPIATCQDCHMSTFPAVCGTGGDRDAACPSGTSLLSRLAGAYPDGSIATASEANQPVTTHYLTGVDLPLSHEYPDALIDEDALDVSGIPLSPRRRRDLLLRRTFRFELETPSVRGASLSVPIQIENLRAGHRVPAGFSQEREIWVHLRVTGGDGRLVYEVGRVDNPSTDLADKVFDRINTNPDSTDRIGRPEGMFGADVRDGPDKPEWSPRPDTGATSFRGRGLVNFQNGFLRCVTCIGEVSADGSCQPGPGQGILRADRFADGDYDIDTGECRSNLSGTNAFFETYLPVGALDASRGLPKAPDAIIDTRSAPPETPITYTYELDTRGARPPFRVEAELEFRAFPPYLIRAFAAYENEQARRGRRPSGPLVDLSMLQRLDVVVVAAASATVR